MSTAALLWGWSTAWGKRNLVAFQKPPSRKPPHILFVLVDDLGWGDVGFHDLHNDPEIMTPVMDELASSHGIILNRHYVHSSCTGTRTSLQSGRLPVHVQVTLKNPEDPSSGMPRNMTALGELMKSARYRTHYVGKWDVGMATPKHTPYGRGYETSLHYFEHKNDYWNQSCLQSACCRNFTDSSAAAAAAAAATTTATATARSCHDDNAHRYNSWEGPSPEIFYNLSLADLWDTHGPAHGMNGSDYEEYIFLQRMNDIIEKHDPAEPLFLFYAPHIAHCPLQVPQIYLDKLNFVSNDSQQCSIQTHNILPINATHQPKPSCRKQYRAMVNMLDDLLGQVVDGFKQNGLWEDTLLVFTSDNGGPIHLKESGSTNYDLRGGKYSDWEGGVRATAFVSGGYLDESRRGITLDEPIHIVDWYATLPAIAGFPELLDDSDSTSASRGNMPSVDALNIWPLLAGDTDVSPRQEIPLSHHSLIQSEMKLIWREEVPESGWTGPQYPNASSTEKSFEVSVDCSDGCLYNVAKDRGEHINVASQFPAKLETMKKRLVELRKGFFQNDDKGVDACPPDINMPCACWMAVNYYGGFLGPYQEVEMRDEDLSKPNLGMEEVA